MPQVICRYSPTMYSTSDLESLGLAVRPLVAAAASTPEKPLSASDVEWLVQPNNLGSLAPRFALEIRTIGYPARKSAMNEAAMRELKNAIHGLPEFPSDLSLNGFGIWVQFLDPDGVHV